MLKIGTWNVNSVKVRLERLLGVLERHQPDALCLQEIKCVDENFPLEEIKKAGYQAQVFGQKTYNGVALLTKDSVENAERNFPNVPEEEARYVTGELNNVGVASAYVPNGQEVGSDRYFYKLNWLHHLKQHLETHLKKQKDFVLVGDFNIAPEALDVCDPKAWAGKILCSTPERNALDQFFELGFVDVFRLHNTTGKQFTWWDYRQLAFPKNQGLRIDLILASAGMAKRCKKAYIDRDERKGEKPSDHAPVFAEFS